MAYTNLTTTQEKNLVNALTTQFMGLDQNAMLRFADVLAGVLADTADGLQDDIDTLTSGLAAAVTYQTNLNTWATALATKLNSDAGVTDTNYDTNAQA